MDKIKLTSVEIAAEKLKNLEELQLAKSMLHDMARMAGETGRYAPAQHYGSLRAKVSRLGARDQQLAQELSEAKAAERAERDSSKQQKSEKGPTKFEQAFIKVARLRLTGEQFFAIEKEAISTSGQLENQA